MRNGRASALILLTSMALMIAAAAAAGPEITITTDRSEYTGGDTIAVSLSGKNDGESIFVDVYIGLIYPDGDIYTYSGQYDDWIRGPFSWISGLEVPGGFAMGETPFKFIDLPSGEPSIYDEGKYAFAAGLAHSGTLEFIGEISQAPFHVVYAPHDCYLDGEAGNGHKRAPMEDHHARPEFGSGV